MRLKNCRELSKLAEDWKTEKLFRTDFESLVDIIYFK